MADRSPAAQDSASPEEVLVGAELYLYLLNENDRQLREAREKQAEYQALRDDLLDLVKRPRRQVMAPVAGGLAYFDTTLNATNNILVLLGDSWFAERSASQAAEIAERRVNFLKRELQVLQEERRSYESRQEMFLSEMPDADQAMASILETKAQDMERAHRATLLTPTPITTTTTTTPAMAASASAEAPTATPRATPTPAAAAAAAPQTPDGTWSTAGTSSSPAPTAASPPPSSTLCEPAEKALSSPSPSVPALSDDIMSLAALCGVSAAELKALSVIDESDDLTEEELMALETELGERVDDDAYVEELMMQRVVAKTEQRLRAELMRRAAEVPPRASPASAPQTTSGRPPFQSPADIGHLPASSASPAPAPTAPTEAPPAAPASSAATPKAERRVHFAETVDVRLPSTTTSTSAALAHDGGPSSLAQGPSGGAPSRQSISVGEIVEHVSSGPLASSTAAMAPQAAASSKRKSLFMRGLDGDN